MNPDGTVWVVLDGIARGYVSGELFDRVHGWRRRKLYCGGPLGHQSCSWGWADTVFHHIPTISVIQEGAPMSLDSTMISNHAGTVFLFENNTIRGIPSAAVMDKYQFNWSTAGHNVYNDDVIMRLQSGAIIQ